MKQFSAQNLQWWQSAEMFFSIFNSSSHTTRLVGGLVRDSIMGRDTSAADLDFATELLPQEIIAVAESAGLKAFPTGIEHGTVTVVFKAVSVQITTLREDVLTDGRHAKVQFGRDWIRDAQRRDFTFNALYISADGSVFDPLGGFADCIEKKVRFIGDAQQRIREDYLRIYRYFRFSATMGNDHFEASALEAIKHNTEGIKLLSRERIGAEMRKLLAAENVTKTLGVMKELEIISDALLSNEAITAIGKAEQGAGQLIFFLRVAMMCYAGTPIKSIANEWRLSRDEQKTIENIIDAVCYLRANELYKAKYFYPEYIKQACIVLMSFSELTSAQAETYIKMAGEAQVAHFPITSSDLMVRGYVQGKPMGDLLKYLENQWISSGFELTREDLLKLILEAKTAP